MSKNQVLRSDQPHQVQMPEGSKTASRKRTGKTSEPAIEERPEPARRLKTPPTPTAPAVAAPKPVPAPAPAARTKAKLGTRARTPERKASAPAAAPAPARPVLAETPADNLLWETPSPVMERLQQLRNRNAQIAEQIQRLTLTLPSRGRAS